MAGHLVSNVMLCDVLLGNVSFLAEISAVKIKRSFYPVYCPDIPLGDPIGKLITISGRFLVNDDGIYKLEDCIFICDGILDPSDAE